MFDVTAGESFTVFLQWDQWPTSAQDYVIRIYQLDAGGNPVTQVATSGARPSQAPTKRLAFTNGTGGTLTYGIAVVGTASSVVGTTLDVKVARVLDSTLSPIRYGVLANSVVDPGNSPSALTAVGWCYEPPHLFNDDASGPSLSGAMKPDLAAPSWVSTRLLSSTECQNGFGGTGAAAAHVAGAAALLLQRTPSLTVDQLRQAVLDRTVDAATPGPDNDTGRGALMLGPPSNGAPNAGPVNASAKAGVATAITLAGTDPDGDTLTYAILSNPAHGTLTGTGPSVTYTPDPRYRGSDSFTYRVTDPFAQASGVGLATIEVVGAGYYIVLADGTPQAHGNVPDLPAPSGAVQPGEVAVGVAPRPQGDGYWIALRNGKVIAVGGAQPLGDASAVPLNRGIVGISSTASGHGYWLVAGDGGIFSFGDAVFFGSMGGTTLNQPVVGMSPTPTSQGYWLVATDGGIFSFGDARFQGSTGAFALNQPVFSMSPTRDGNGYWLVARDGGIFAFGTRRVPRVDGRRGERLRRRQPGNQRQWWRLLPDPSQRPAVRVRRRPRLRRAGQRRRHGHRPRRRVDRAASARSFDPARRPSAGGRLAVGVAVEPVLESDADPVAERTGGRPRPWWCEIHHLRHRCVGWHDPAALRRRWCWFTTNSNTHTTPPPTDDEPTRHARVVRGRQISDGRSATADQRRQISEGRSAKADGSGRWQISTAGCCRR